jgi:hypothetical protein
MARARCHRGSLESKFIPPLLFETHRSNRSNYAYSMDKTSSRRPRVGVSPRDKEWQRFSEVLSAEDLKRAVHQVFLAHSNTPWLRKPVLEQQLPRYLCEHHRVLRTLYGQQPSELLTEYLQERLSALVKHRQILMVSPVDDREVVAYAENWSVPEC